jgi:hypothetical protein
MRSIAVWQLWMLILGAGVGGLFSWAVAAHWLRRKSR